MRSWQGFTSRFKLTRFLVIGRAAPETLELLGAVAQRWGWARPTRLRAPAPPWLYRMLYTGESLACRLPVGEPNMAITPHPRTP